MLKREGGRGAAPLRAQLLEREGVERDGPLNTTRFRDPRGGGPQGKLLNACSVEPRPAGRWGSRREAARRAVTVAATPTGVKVTRLATCCREGTAVGSGTRPARESFVGGTLRGGWVALAREIGKRSPPVSL